MTGFALLFGLLCVFGGLQSGALAQKFSYPSALERVESLVGSLNESLHETKEDLQEVKLCLNETKKKLGEVQREKESLEAQLLETRNELANTKSLHQQAIDELRATQDSNKVEALEETRQIRMKVSALEDEELPRQLSELNEDLRNVTRDLRRLEDDNLPRRVHELANEHQKMLTKLVTVEFKHNSTTLMLKEALEAQLLETQQELATTISLSNSRMEALEKGMEQVRMNVSVLEDEELPKQINALNENVSEAKRHLRRLEDENLPRAVNELAIMMEQRLNTVYSNFSKVKGEVQLVEKELYEIVQNITTQVEDVQQRSTQGVAGLSEKVRQASTVASQQQDSIDSLRRDMLQQNITVTRLSDRVTQHDTTTDRLQQQVAEQESSVSSLSSNIDVLRRDLQQQSDTVTRLNDRVTQHDTTTNRLQQQVAEQESSVSSLSSNIDGLRRDLQQQSDTVNSLSVRVTQHGTTTDGLQQRIAKQENSINSLASNIQMQIRTTETLTSSTTEQGVRIAHLKDDLELMKTDARNLSEVQYQQMKKLSSDVMQLLNCNNPTSCEELYQRDSATPSGHYNICTPQGVKRVYCEMEPNDCGDVKGGWMRVAHINMTDPRQTCPRGLVFFYQGSYRMCTHSYTGIGPGCSSVTFPQHGVPYTKVCGRARGQQRGFAESFIGFHRLHQTLEGYYVMGLSVTHGAPRRHIWTFAAGVSKDGSSDAYQCPCALYQGAAPPPFVGENYYCEAGWGGWSKQWPYFWHLDDPMWDSQGCPEGSTCCDRGGPWFNTTLSQEVSDDIEVRWCYNSEGRGNFAIDQLEILVH